MNKHTTLDGLITKILSLKPSYWKYNIIHPETYPPDPFDYKSHIERYIAKKGKITILLEKSKDKYYHPNTAMFSDNYYNDSHYTTKTNYRIRIYYKNKIFREYGKNKDESANRTESKKIHTAYNLIKRSINQYERRNRLHEQKTYTAAANHELKKFMKTD